MGNFYTDVIQKNVRFRSLARVSDVFLLEPTFRAKVQAVMLAAPLRLMVFETYRSAERQVLLFNQGATKLKEVGVHHYGLACDIVRSIAGEPSWKGDFGFLGDLARKNGLVWGGDWAKPQEAHTFRDMDHVQRVSLADQERLFSGEWYPDDAYVPDAVGAAHSAGTGVTGISTSLNAATALTGA